MHNNKNNQRYLFEDKNITNAEYRPGKNKVKNLDNTIAYKKTSILEKKIAFNIQAEVQKRTSTINRQEIEEEATNIINHKLIKLNLVDETGKVLISKEMREIAIAEESRKIMKMKINNRFEFSKNELLEITKTSSNNAYHLSKTLNNLQGKDTHTIYESYVTEDFSEIRQRKMNINMFPMTGEDISLTNLDSDEKILIKIDEDYIPYTIVPNKRSIGDKQGFNMLFADIFESFTSEYSQIFYKIIVDIENIWQNKEYTYKEFQKFFGTKYGIKKKIDALGNPKKNQANDFIYELDSNDNYIYDEEYLKTYRFFKKEVINKAIEEINSDKTPYLVKLIEIRDNLRSPIKFIKIEVQRKKNEKYNDYARYSSISYFVSVQKQFEKANSKDDLISNLDAYAEKISPILINQETYNTPIAGAITYKQLDEIVKENNIAIKEIKEILNKNIKSLMSYKFNEKYLILTNTKYPRSSRLMIHRKVGETAIECLQYIKSKYSEELKKHIDKKEKKFSQFLNFKFFDKTENQTISINSKNVNIYEKKMHESIKNGNKRDFKAFRSMTIKKKFAEIFFGE